MEENFLLAKETVLKKYSKENPYYAFFVCALYGLFQKRKNNIEMIVKAFLETRIIIEDGNLREIFKKHVKDNINLNPNASAMSYRLSMIAYHNKRFIHFLGPVIICSKNKSITTEELLSSFVHEMNHIIDTYCYKEKSETKSGVQKIRLQYGFSVIDYTVYPQTRSGTLTNRYEELSEATNCLRTKEMLEEISHLKEIVDMDIDIKISTFLKSLNKEKLSKPFGYDELVYIIQELWNIDSFKSLIENNPEDAVDIIDKKFGENYLNDLVNKLKRLLQLSTVIPVEELNKTGISIEKEITEWKKAFDDKQKNNY